MLRRFEIYTVAPSAPPERVAAMEQAFWRCGEFIPEVVHSVVGSNRSSLNVQVVWEHAYASSEAYQRYMAHPFHANILDRYLLSDSPERLVTESPLVDGGLVGYSCQEPVYHLEKGTRKLVLFGLDGPDEARHSFIATLRGLAGTVDGVVLSVVEPNTFGAAWMDGVTPITAAPSWTHVWELGFVSDDAYRAYQEGTSPTAVAERDGWRSAGGLVTKAAEMVYEVDEAGGGRR